MADLHDNGERRHAHLVGESTEVLPDIIVGICKTTAGCGCAASSPSPCSWGRRFARSKETSRRPAACGCLSAEQTENTTNESVNDSPGKVKSRRHQCVRAAYRPRLVAQVVDGREGVDARDAAVLQPNDQVAEIFVLGHTVGMLADEDKVWLERPKGGRRTELEQDVAGGGRLNIRARIGPLLSYLLEDFNEAALQGDTCPGLCVAISLGGTSRGMSPL